MRKEGGGIKSYAIELTEDEVKELMLRFHCKTDAELRELLQQWIWDRMSIVLPVEIIGR